MSQLRKLIDWIPAFRSDKRAMAQTPEFKATHTFKVSHENAEVLEAYLRKELGFKPEDIKTRACFPKYHSASSPGANVTTLLGNKRQRA